MPGLGDHEPRREDEPNTLVNHTLFRSPPLSNMTSEVISTHIHTSAHTEVIIHYN
jgi:hypothetical protein